jgi:hypothetical protein
MATPHEPRAAATDERLGRWKAVRLALVPALAQAVMPALDRVTSRTLRLSPPRGRVLRAVS